MRACRWLGWLGFACLVVSLPTLGCADDTPGDGSGGDDGDLPRVGGPKPSQIPFERLPETTSAFTERACWSKPAGYVTQCGTVTVPESPGSSRTVELGVARVFSEDSNPAEEPVVYLDGGPGGSILGMLSASWSAFSFLARDRDVIFVDQRGTGVSTPSLECTESGELEAAIPACYARLDKKADPAAYTSANNARDFDDVRRALGYEQWNLYGISYGTRLGLTILRDYPLGVRAAILDAVVPLDVDLFAHLGQNGQSAFEEVFATCQADAVCADKYPDSMAQMRAVAARLDAEPVDVGSYDLTGTDFVLVLFNLLYSPVALTYVPLIIDAADGGDFALFEELSVVASGDGFSFGMHLSVQCAEEMPFTSLETILDADEEVYPEIVGGLSGRDYVDYCSAWPVPAAPAIENEPVSSSVPTLVMAGRFDPITPAAYSERVDSQLSDSYYYFVSNDSHGSSLGDCGSSIVSAFLRDPTKAPPNTACLETLPAPEFESFGGRARSARVGGTLDIATEPPSAEEVERIVNDLRQRLQLEL